MKGGGIKNTKAKPLAAVQQKRPHHQRRMEKVLKVDVHTPPAPAHFNDIQRQKWDDIVKKFIAAGIWQNLDADALQAYVENWLIMEDMLKLVNDQGPVIWIETPSGKKPIRNPAHIAYMEAFKVWKPLVEQFGMTPRARQSVIVNAKVDTYDPLDDL